MTWQAQVYAYCLLLHWHALSVSNMLHSQNAVSCCNKQGDHSCTVQDKECKASKIFGKADSGVLASWPGADFDLSQIYNKTQSAMTSDGFSMSNFLNSFVGEATPASASANATASIDASDEATPNMADGSTDSTDASGDAASDSADGSTASIEANL